MRRWGLREILTLAVLGPFLASMAVPRAAFFFHSHAGGERVHVHDDRHEHDHHAGADHPHHDHLAAGHPDLPGFEAPDDDEPGHWHSQGPFHRITPVVVAILSEPQLLGRAPAQARRNFLSSVAVPGRARSPPLCTVG